MVENRIFEMENTFIFGQNHIGIPNSNVKKVDRKLKSFLISLSLTELNNYLEEIPENNNNKFTKLVTKFFQKYKTEESTNEILLEISQFIKTDKFELIISDVLEKFDSELTHNKRSVSTFQSFKSNHLTDKEEQKRNFFEANKNGSIIQKLFYILKEKIIYCKCNKITYDYNFDKFLLIDLNKENDKILLNNKLFKIQKMNKTDECKFCSKKNNKNVEESFIDFPNILIIYLKGEKLYNFSLSKSNYYPNNFIRNVFYSLVAFIELNTNLVYFKIKNNWYNYNENDKLETANIEFKKPIILIYKLLNNNNNNSDKNNDINSNKLFQNNINKSVKINLSSNNNMNNIVHNNENKQQKTNSENIHLNSDKIYNNNDNMNIKKEINNMNKNMNNNLNLEDNINDGNNNISNLKHELDESKKTIEEQKNIINDLRNQLNEKNLSLENNKTMIQSLRNVISNKENEIYQLKCGLNNNFQNNFNLNFIIQEEQKNYSIPCNSNDIFAKIEEKLYEIFPEYRETENYFLFKGRKILRFKSIFENQIQNNYPVLMVIIRSDDKTIVRP